MALHFVGTNSGEDMFNFFFFDSSDNGETYDNVPKYKRQSGPVTTTFYRPIAGTKSKWLRRPLQCYFQSGDRNGVSCHEFMKVALTNCL